jgi:hypothetical protein
MCIFVARSLSGSSGVQYTEFAIRKSAIRREWSSSKWDSEQIGESSRIKVGGFSEKGERFGYLSFVAELLPYPF